MLLLGVDLETTGLDIESDRITEIGAVLWDTERHMPMAMLSELTIGKDYPPLSEEITRLTGIDDAMLDAYGEPINEVVALFDGLARSCDFIVAHNGALFDRPMLEAEHRREELPLAWDAMKWIDTMCDVPYPASIKTRKLGYLAAEHGFLNPFAHRAVFDVLTMLRVLDEYDINEVAQLALSPRRTAIARTTKPWLDGGKSNDAARALGYRWDGAQKLWTKTIHLCQIDAERCAADFEIEILEE